MIATTAKLRALLEAKDYVALSVAAPDLARLVVTLTEALVCDNEHWCGTCYAEFGEQKTVPPSCLDEYKADHRKTNLCDSCKALAAVEELGL